MPQIPLSMHNSSMELPSGLDKTLVDARHFELKNVNCFFISLTMIWDSWFMSSELQKFDEIMKVSENQVILLYFASNKKLMQTLILSFSHQFINFNNIAGQQIYQWM